MKTVRVASVEEVESDETYDIWNYQPDAYRDSTLPEGNFLVNGVVVHNSIPEAVKNRDDVRGTWKRKLDPDFLKVLEDTYGVIVYQEQLQALWQNIAGFTSPEAQEARKAVAKKWVHKLKPIEKKWIEGASRKIGKAAAEEWWPKMVTFGRYAFNKCLDKDTLLADAVTNVVKTVEEWRKQPELPTLESFDGDSTYDQCVAIHDTGVQEIFQITFDNGQVEMVTINHKFLCSDGLYHEVREIIDKGLDVVEAGSYKR